MKTTLLRAFALFSAAWLCMGGAKADVTPEEPSAEDGVYQIGNAAELVWFSNHVNEGNYAANAVLTADIDMSAVDNFTPIGEASSYNGTFDGVGHVISSLTITKSESNANRVGLFGTMGGMVKNLCVKDVLINNESTTADATGAIVGRNGSGKLYNCCAVNVTINSAVASSDNETYGAICGYLSSAAATEMIECYSANAKGKVGSSAASNLACFGKKGAKATKVTDNYDGSSAYRIASAINLKWFSEIINASTSNITANAELAADIDMSSVTNFKPIGLTSHSGTHNSNNYAYKGSFDGQGHTISNLTIAVDDEESWQVGLFGRIFNATVKNLGLKTVSITQTSSTAAAAGALAGRNGSSTVQNCYAVNVSFTQKTSKTSTSAATSGLVGYMSGSEESKIINCYTDHNRLTVLGTSNNVTATATNCYSGSVTATGIEAIGERAASGELCYLLNESSSENPVWFQNLSGEETDAYPVLNKTHATVYITALQCDGITPATGANYSNDPNATVIEPHGTFTGGFCDKCGNMLANGDGFYEIESADQLLWFGNYVNKGETESKALLKASIGMAGKGWTAMNEFAGTFDGNNFTISNLDAPFCYSTEGNCVIRNLTLSADADLVYSGTENGFGAFVCQNNKLNAAGSLLIENCVNNTEVDNRSGKNWTGGFIGGAANGSADVTTTIRNCVNNATIKSTAEAVSGFIGNSRKGRIVIENCVNNGAIVGPKAMGGFIGQAQTPNFITITGSHNTANVTATGNANSRVAGIVGALYESSTTVISGCWNVGNVSGEHDTAAGILGYMDQHSSSLTISDCYNVGKISAETNAAGILGSASVGSTAMNLTNCWNNGAVTGGDAAKPFAPTTAKTTCTNCYDVNGSQTGVTAVTAAQLESGEITYKLNGDQSDIVWKQTIDTDATPVLDSSRGTVYQTVTSGTNNYYANSTSGFTLPSMTLTDAQNYTATGDFTATSLTYARKLEAGGYHSLCLPFAITTDMLSEAGGKLFKLKNVGDEAVTLTETDRVEAGVPCFASVTSDFNFNTLSLTGVTMKAAVSNGTNVKGSFTNETIGAGFYKLSSNGTYFGETTGGATVTAFRSYIQPSGVGVKTLNILLSDGTITGLTPALSEEREAVVYDLAGRRVEKATKGLYIINGKKVVK